MYRPPSFSLYAFVGFRLPNQAAYMAPTFGQRHPPQKAEAQMLCIQTSVYEKNVTHCTCRLFAYDAMGCPFSLNRTISTLPSLLMITVWLLP